MANNKSAIKNIRKTEKRRIQNRNFRNRTRTLVKKAKVTISKGTLTDAVEATRLAVKDLDMAASRGLIHPRNAARRKSRLMRQLATLQKQSA